MSREKGDIVIGPRKALKHNIFKEEKKREANLDISEALAGSFQLVFIQQLHALQLFVGCHYL